MGANDEITLMVDGGTYTGWIEADITRSLDRFAHSFSLQYVDRWTDKIEPWPIRPFTPCQIKYGNHILITGRVDVSSFKLAGDSWRLSASGRSKTADLVDCSAIHKTGQWRNKLAIQIARDLVEPYGLQVAIQVPDNEPIKRFTIEEGESVHDALDRLTKNRGYLPHTLADGNVGFMRVLDFVGAIGDAPIDDALDRELSEDVQDVFSQYKLRSQSCGEDKAGDPITVLRKFDGGVDSEIPHRPLVLVADADSNRDDLEKRAKWEQNVRLGRSIQLKYTFLGVLDERGFPWAPGDHHHVRDDALGIDETMLVSSAKISVDDRRLTTQVEFTRPEAFSLLTWPDTILNRVTKKGRPKVKKSRTLDLQK